MKRLAWMTLVAALVPLGAATARAELCEKCKGMMFIMSVGKCVECGGATGSGAHKLCRKCSGKLGQCEHCRGPLGASGVIQPKEPTGLVPIGQGLDMQKGGTYTAGKWKYVLVVRALGTRSEGRLGTLFHDGGEVPEPQMNDHFKTPWGLLYWVGTKSHRFGDQGWMPHKAQGGPGYDREGKLLPAPGAGDGAGAQEPLQLDDASNGKTVQAAAGQQIHLSLKGSITTGYSWQLKGIEGAAVRQIGKAQYVQDPAPGRRVGVGGRFLFKFQAVGPGEAAISLAYARPWEKDKPPDRTFTLNVTVAAAADLTADRAKLLAETPGNFALHLWYIGPQDKPYYSLLLTGARPKAPRPGEPEAPAEAFSLRESITKQQVEKIVAHLAECGFLRDAKDALKESIPPATGPCYLLRVTGGPRDKVMDLRGNLAWGPEMFRKLDGLRPALFSPASEAMDRLLQRLSGHRKQAEGPPLERL